MGLKDGTAVVVVDEAVVVWAEEEHAPVGDDVGDEKGAGISDECKANVEGRRMSRAAEISLMTEPVGSKMVKVVCGRRECSS